MKKVHVKGRELSQGRKTMSWIQHIKNFFIGKPSGERARNKKGHFIPDDPETPHINEAYKDGYTPENKLY